MLTKQGMALLFQSLTGSPVTGAVKIALRSDAPATPDDTAESHAWTLLSDFQETSFSAMPDGVVVNQVVLTATQDGVAHGCAVMIGDTLFAVSTFEPRSVVQGDTVASRYALTAAPAEDDLGVR